jgi:hypothetical protein
MKLVKKLFTRHLAEIRTALEEDVESWSSEPSGPFNTDPLFEPRLAVLCENPKGWIEDSETRDGVRFLSVIYVLDATIICNRYKDNGPDEPLSMTEVVGGVTYEVPASFEVNLQTGESFVIDINSIFWRKWEIWRQLQSVND